MVRRFLGDDVVPAVRDAMLAVPRHWCVPYAERSRAYDDVALPIGHGQTISQPRVVAHMLGILRLTSRMRVLDVGAGSGYATLLLSRLVASGQVVAIERCPGLIPATRSLIAECTTNVLLRWGDGLRGDPEGGGFDAIHVACAVPEIPPGLISCLRPHGRMVLPLGEHGTVQQLTLLHKDARGGVSAQELGAVTFVPGLPGLPQVSAAEAAAANQT
jgi:protein-L-isoaspartate(D-aspartate) O-methyltransferase